MNPYRSSLGAAVLALFVMASGFAHAAGAKKIPFHGKLQAVDTSAQTITLSGKSARVFHLTAETKIKDGGGNPTTLSAAVVGEDVGGSYMKGTDGTMTLYSVRLGAKTGTAAKTEESTAAAAPAPAPAQAATPSMTAAAPAAAAPEPAVAAPAAKAKKQSFSGKVVSVDAASNTLVVHGRADQTFTVTSSTKITSGGAPATLADATTGARVTGSYMKSADGSTLTVATLKITK